jgi:hypothetical protein
MDNQAFVGKPDKAGRAYFVATTTKAYQNARARNYYKINHALRAVYAVVNLVVGEATGYCPAGAVNILNKQRKIRLFSANMFVGLDDRPTYKEIASFFRRLPSKFNDLTKKEELTPEEGKKKKKKTVPPPHAIQPPDRRPEPLIYREEENT